MSPQWSEWEKKRAAVFKENLGGQWKRKYEKHKKWKRKCENYNNEWKTLWEERTDYGAKEQGGPKEGPFSKEYEKSSLHIT